MKKGVITHKAGSGNYYFEDKLLAKSEQKFQDLLESDKDLRAKLLKKANINTLSRLELKLQRLTAKAENRYPVKVKGKAKKQTEVEDDDDDE